VVSDEVGVGRGNESDKPARELDGFESDLRSSVRSWPGSQESEVDTTGRVEGQAVVGERCAQAIAAQAFEAHAVRGTDMARGVQGEPVDLSAEALVDEVSHVVVDAGGRVSRESQGLGQGGKDVRLLVLGARGLVLNLFEPLARDFAEASCQAGGECLDVLVGRWRERGEVHGAVMTRDEEAVGENRMKMRIQVRDTAETLYESH
jgi:hypothetical protein